MTTATTPSGLRFQIRYYEYQQKLRPDLFDFYQNEINKCNEKLKEIQ